MTKESKNIIANAFSLQMLKNKGATELPEGCVFKYYKISVKDE